ncbi:hypothetical protein PoB_007037200 [Plakobranchus ocellatus]|uniref:Uncharacterized protein n=1 Tax=Plakobranchus ocellatus TaxID=259542 RepID=A0AAV4DIL0_9GAST|nr:hypothetical protein PoB_007037200 [Plakobranchus ocellatus]
MGSTRNKRIDNDCGNCRKRVMREHIHRLPMPEPPKAITLTLVRLCGEDAIAEDATPITSEEVQEPSDRGEQARERESADLHLDMLHLPRLPGLYHDHVLHYITSFICRKIQSKTNCNICAATL